MDRATFHKLCFILQSVCGLKSSWRGCLGALDDIYIDVHVPVSDKGRLRSGFSCSVNALNKENGMKVPKGCYACVLIGYIFVVISGMDQFGNKMGQDVERVKVSRGRRSWSKIEEDALILCLTNVVLEGWKSENGFKAGFQRELEKDMRKIIPATDIVANPHINSKIHVWKKEYGALSDLLSKSGICWNSTTSMLEVEDEGVWESCKRWIEIFRKDRAIGENDVDLIDHINELYRTGMDQEGDTGDKYVPLTPEYMNDIEDDVADKPVDLTPKVFTKGKKRKSNDSDITMLVDSLGEFMKFSKSAMTDLSTGAEKGSASSNDNKQLNVIMKGIVGLKVSDKLKCVTRIHGLLSLESEAIRGTGLIISLTAAFMFQSFVEISSSSLKSMSTSESK
ncbi:hypothetical protein ACS0TY_007906 [Phlomoides rotata]